MRLIGSKALITGAAGGIGRAISMELLAAGAEVLMVDRDSRALALAASAADFAGARLETFVADLTSAPDRARLCHAARAWHGGVNILINNAGLNPFGLYDELTAGQLDAVLAVNLQAPLHLCRELLPHLRSQSAAAIVNMGSVFGAIGFPGYVAYSTTKFALRGFTEALRRELAGSGVVVKYLAPRATLTPINSSEVQKMNAELGVSMDPPERVARELLALLRSSRNSAVVGWPEKLFVRVNALLPSIVDRGIRKQRPIVEKFARAAATAAASPMPDTLSLRKTAR